MSGSHRPVGRITIEFILLGLVAAACSTAGTSPSAPSVVAPTAAPSSPATSAGSAAGGRYGGAYGSGSGAGASSAASVVVTMAASTLGPVLTGPSGLTLYVHAGDTATSSTCTGGCASAWPPLTVASGGAATAGPGVMGALATLTRADGTTQVTYNGMPLYGWKNDTKPGDVTGQNINGFTVAKP